MSLKQIYHVEEQPEDRFVLDPQRGPVMRRELIMKASSQEKIVRGDNTYEVRPDGTFMVDEHTAAFLLSRPGWHSGPNPFFVDVEIEPAQPPVISKAKTRAS
jgi:hypothetical protein